MIGTTLSHFKITGKLGEGGMGEVYRAEDSKLGREVALKVLPEAFAQDHERMGRFAREAQVLASLNHTNIAAIYGLEEDGGRHALVMELVEGETLQERIARGPVSLAEAAKLGLEIARAMETAHDKGIVHRDLKPANVKITPEGQVKVLDFGLAKALEEEPDPTNIANSPTLTAAATQAGIILGTAAYMSPEQAAGSVADRRSDIWSYGVVLSEMLTGRQQFAGETVSHTLASVLKDEPEWERFPQDLPPRILDLLQRCLRKDAKQRLQAIGDARVVWEEYLADPEAFTVAVSAAPAAGYEPVPAWKRILPWAIAAVLAVAAAGFGWGLWRAASATPPGIVRAFIPAPPDGDFDLVTDYPAPVALSPDGRSLVFGVEEDSGKLLWVRDLDDIEARPLNGTDGAMYPFWSPDSRFIGFFAGTKLKKIEATGGPVMTLCDAPNGKGGTWNDDGVIVFAPSHIAGLQSVSAAGGEPAEVTTIRPDLGEDSHRHPRFLPDGEHFLFVARSGFGGQSGNSRVMLGSLAGGEPVQVMQATSNVEYAAGHLLYVFERTLMARPFDIDRLELAGDAFPIAENLYADLGAVLGVFSVSEQGVLAYQTGTQREDILSTLQWVDRSGNVLETVGEAEPYQEVNLSPDGKTAVVNLSDPKSGNRDLWLVDLERQLKTRFTFDESQDWIAAWSPDGERIVFSSERGGSSNLYVKSVLGSGEAELLYADEPLKYPLSWSPDGSYVFFESWGTDGGVDVMAVDVESGEPLEVVKGRFNERAPVISPDGRWLAYVSDESGRDELYVTAFPEGGRRYQVSTDGADFARWAGRAELVIIDPVGMVSTAEVDGSTDSFRVGEIRQIAQFDRVGGGFSFDVSPDGQRYLTLALEIPEDQPAKMDPLTLVLNWTRDLERR